MKELRENACISGSNHSYREYKFSKKNSFAWVLNFLFTSVLYATEYDTNLRIQRLLNWFFSIIISIYNYVEVNDFSKEQCSYNIFKTIFIKNVNQFSSTPYLFLYFIPLSLKYFRISVAYWNVLLLLAIPVHESLHYE